MRHEALRSSAGGLLEDRLLSFPLAGPASVHFPLLPMHQNSSSGHKGVSFLVINLGYKSYSLSFKNVTVQDQ